MTGEQCDILHTDLINILEELRKIKEWCEPHWVKVPEVKENVISTVSANVDEKAPTIEVKQRKNKKQKNKLFVGDSDHEK